ncbi:hypothetical protein [Flavobacterium sp. ZS1P14]|uniref:hypothetical protein n=1 Tax=Flavobacterium sp. ZS1P14 TaxID=3401729 RepID=UPI003AACE46F
MTKVRLEIDSITIHRPKKRWQIYFVVIADHPTEDNKMIVTTLPQGPIKLSPFNNNLYHFDTSQEGAEGLFLMSRKMPKSRELNVHLYVRHSRSKQRDLYEVLKNVETGLTGETFGMITNVVGTAAVPWLVISKKAISMIGNVLSKINDRDLGFISAFERFGPEFEDQTEIDREKPGSDCTIVYSWSVED